MPLIGINGLKSSGKDTVAERLIEKYNYKYISFAAKLKESAASLWGFDPIKWEEWKNDSEVVISIFSLSSADPHESVTAREFLQRYGTESHRDIFGQGFWVEHALRGINPSLEKYVIPDTRFENEIDAIHNLGGIVVRIVRDEVESNDTHASEVPPPLHKIDYTIDNNGGLTDLYKSVDDFEEWFNEDYNLDITYGDEYENKT